MRALALVLCLVACGGDGSPSVDADPNAPDGARLADGGVDADPSGPDAALPRDGLPVVTCGGTPCNPGEWCDTSGGSPACRCGQPEDESSCNPGDLCCESLSGCEPEHCAEYCAASCG